MINFGAVPASSTLPVFFDSYAGATGASITITGLAVTDIEIYKGTSMTQRSSDAGYVLLDTDGIDIDGITGIHGFSIDTGDNTDAGFYAAGSFYSVVVSAITVDSQTVNFLAATFRIVAAESISGTPKADVAAWLGTAAATPTVAGVPEVDTTHWNGTAVTTPPAVNATQISGDSVAADNAEAFFDGTGYAGTGNVIPTVTTLTNLPAITANWLTAAGIAAGALDGKGNWNIGKTGYSLTATTGLGNQTADITGSLSGSVGSVTGAVGSVTGAVGSVTGAVGSVTGNVGGNVVGSVASVTAAVAITSNIKINQALAGFEFLMTDSTNHEPATGLTVTVTRSINGGAFAAGTLSAVSEIGNGIYSVDFGAGDLNGKVITLQATAAASDTTFERIVTQA